jgi:hypothetical protein
MPTIREQGHRPEYRTGHDLREHRRRRESENDLRAPFGAGAMRRERMFVLPSLQRLFMHSRDPRYCLVAPAALEIDPVARRSCAVEIETAQA